LEGNLVKYHCELYPEVNIGRTTVRKILYTDYKLARSITICSEVLQLSRLRKSILLSMGIKIPKSMTEVYNGVIENGFDWNVIYKTRGYWIPNQYGTKEIPFISSVDILRMATGDYIPYFMDKDKKVLKEYKQSLDIMENEFSKRHIS
jgi:hypothetical protein